MLFAYIDETGDTGDPFQKKGASSHFALGCVLVRAEDWNQTHEQMVNFRRQLRDDFGVHVRSELKANYLIRNRGPLRKRPLPPNVRKRIYSLHLEQIQKLNARAFSVCIDKSKNRGKDIFDTAWTYLLQRLERTCNSEGETVVIIHDNGNNDEVRKIVRKARRFLTAGSAYGNGSLRFQAKEFLEDPVPRDSEHSYFIQLADLTAYAAWRTIVPPGKSIRVVCHETMWDNLGEARLAKVSNKRNAAPGIVSA